MCSRSFLLHDEEERVAEGRASQLYSLVSGTQQLCSLLSPHATTVQGFLLSVLSPLTTDFCGPNSPLKKEDTVLAAWELYLSRLHYKRSSMRKNQRFKSSVLEINVHFVFRFKEVQQNRGWEVERTEQKVLHV